MEKKSTNPTTYNIFLINVIITIILILFYTGAYAWEADTHYGLTKWLAVKAGFDKDDAEIISAAAEAADETSVLSAKSVVFYNICLKREVEASRLVQQHHFPTSAHVPLLPKDRNVIPGEFKIRNGGNRWVRQEIAVPEDIKVATRVGRLLRFGSSLHPLEDSWSHQGEPDGFPSCPDELEWSHPKSRGGGLSHDADLTYLSPKIALDAAESTYRFMDEFLYYNPDLRKNTTAQWDSVMIKDVMNFISAKTALEKFDWFLSQSKIVPPGEWSTYPCFLKSITLKKHNKIKCFDKIKIQPQAQVQNTTDVLPYIEPGVPNDVSNFVDEFMRRWIVNRDIENLINTYIEPSPLAERITDVTASAVPDNRNQWLQTLFTMWFVSDHGLVNEYGHGLPNNERYNVLATEVVSEQDIGFDRLTQAIHVPGTSSSYLLAPTPSEDEVQSYGVVFQFQHLPKDVIILTVSRVNQDWKVIGISWIPM